MQAVSRRVSERAWIEHYLTDADGDPIEAAKLSGYKTPQKSGPLLIKKYQGQMAELQQKLASKLQMGPGEVLEKYTQIARDDEHKDQIKALDSLAKVHGIFQSDISLNVDRAKMVHEVHELLKTLAALGGAQALPPIADIPSAKVVMSAKARAGQTLARQA